MMRHDAQLARPGQQRSCTVLLRAPLLAGLLSRRALSRAGRVSLVALGAFTLPQLAFGQDESPNKASCAQAYESAQESRASGQLQETRQRLAFCARTECPSFVQKDCARWLVEVERELPSVIVSAPGLDGTEAAQVSVKIDGQIVARGLSGEAVPLDPGPHELVVERPGQDPVTRTIMAQQGVQKRFIEIQFADSSLAPSAIESDAGTSSSPLRPYAFAGWGVGAVGIGLFAVLGTLGRADQASFKQQCAHEAANPESPGPGECNDAMIEAKRSKYEREFIFADVGLVTGIVGAAAGTVLYVMSLSDSSGSSASSSAPDADLETGGIRFDVTPTRGGAWASVEADF